MNEVIQKDRRQNTHLFSWPSPHDFQGTDCLWRTAPLPIPAATDLQALRPPLVDVNCRLSRGESGSRGFLFWAERLEICYGGRTVVSSLWRKWQSWQRSLSSSVGDNFTAQLGCELWLIWAWPFSLVLEEQYKQVTYPLWVHFFISETKVVMPPLRVWEEAKLDDCARTL